MRPPREGTFFAFLLFSGVFRLCPASHPRPPAAQTFPMRAIHRSSGNSCDVGRGEHGGPRRFGAGCSRWVSRSAGAVWAAPHFGAQPDAATIRSVPRAPRRSMGAARFRQTRRRNRTSRGPRKGTKILPKRQIRLAPATPQAPVGMHPVPIRRGPIHSIPIRATRIQAHSMRMSPLRQIPNPKRAVEKWRAGSDPVVRPT